MKTQYHVAPRYTSGSPAQVDGATFLRVARQEYDACRAERGGETPTAAELEGIAYAVVEQGARLYVRDELTADAFLVPARQWSAVPWYARTDRRAFRVPRSVEQAADREARP